MHTLHECKEVRQKAARAAIGISDDSPPVNTALQDGLLAYYLSQAKVEEGNVKARRIEREPFDSPRSGGMLAGGF
jgi:hypothetical protein